MSGFSAAESGQMDYRHVAALSVAGSDSGAGAGIQADLKTFAAMKVYGTSVVTLVTAQNTAGVSLVRLLDTEVISAQLEAVLSDFRIGAIKTGALGSAEIVSCVASYVAALNAPLVIDPVMVSKHGDPLLPSSAIEVLRRELLPIGRVVTPNLSEAQMLTGMRCIESRAEMLAAAKAVMTLGCRAVVIKGGHRLADPVDLLLDAGEVHWLEGERLASPHLHGTGCTFSAAITAGLALGLPLLAATQQAKAFTAKAIGCGRVVGRGINPTNHFWANDH